VGLFIAPKAHGWKKRQPWLPRRSGRYRKRGWRRAM